jgi:hypothetical protein
VISAWSYVLAVAYGGSGEGFVQASIAVAGPLVNGTEMENQTLISNGTRYDVDSFNGTTTTDFQNPLMLMLFPPGVYVLSATYGSAPPQSLTLNVTGWGSWYPAVFNFGSSPPPPMGYLFLSAFASWNGVGSFVPAPVTITGPESFNATAGGDNPPSVFIVPPGAYTMTATYESFPQQTETTNVTDGGYGGAFFCFGGSPPP